MKKLFSLLLAATMTFSLTLPALADHYTYSEPEKSTMMPRSTPETHGMSSQYILDLLDAFDYADAEVHNILMAIWTACRKIDSEIKHPPVVELRKSKLQQEGRFMSRPYTHVQGLLPSVLAMKEEGYTYRQIAKQFGLTKEQVEELCSRARRKQRRIEKGYIPQPKGRPRKTPATQEQLQNNRIVELEMKVELLQNFLSECGRM